MYSTGKYVTGEIGGIGCAVCVTEVIGHDALRGLFNEIWGAGFFHVTDDESSPTRLAASCYGKSVSLGVASEPARDARLVGRALGLLPE